MSYLTLFLIALLGTSAKALQQLNVVQGHRWRIPPVSYIQTLSLVYTTAGVMDIVLAGNSLILAVFASGTGGWMGTFIAMDLTEYLNDRQTKIST